MSAALNWQARYTPAQLESAARIKEIRARQKAAMEARLQRIAEERRAVALAEEQRRRTEAERVAAVNSVVRRAAKAERRTTHSFEVSQHRTTAAVIRIARAYQCEPEDVLGLSRTGDLPAARAHLCALLAMECRASLAAIGRAIGRDHTTVIHYLRSYNAFFGTNVRNEKPVRSSRMKFRDLAAPEPLPLLDLMEGRDADPPAP